MTSNGRGSRGLRIAVAALAALILFALIPAVSSAAAPTIVNNAGSGRWVESQALGMDGAANRFRLTVVVRHDRGEAVDNVMVDDNWSNNNFDTINVTGTRQQTTIANGNAYTRVTLTTTPETGGDDCPFAAPATQRRNDTYGVYAHTSSGNTQTLTATVHRVQSTYNCFTLGDNENYPYLYDQTQNKTSVDLGGSGDDVQFQFKGDDYDSTGDCSSFDGYRWRLRPLGGGATTSATTVDAPGGDNDTQTLNVTSWPGRGRWVVEAELACNTMNFVDVGGWFYIGAVDVNSPSSPTISLGGVPARPATNASFTATANVADTPDAGSFGHVEAVEWDKDGNSVYEEGEISSAWNTDLSAGQLERTINTTGMTPGTYTIRARARDNGAISLADNSSKTAVGTATYTVNSPPVVNGQAITVEEGDNELVNFGATDANSDTLSYSISDPPDHGQLGGSGGSRTYTADPGYEGADSFEVEVNDGYNGIDTATITVQVTNTTKIDSGPSGPHNSQSASFTFSSPEVGATFECSLDSAPWTACTSPQSYAGLSESAHTFEVRAIVSGNPDPTPAKRNFTVDVTDPDTTIDSGPSGPTNDSTPVFTFSSNEPGSTFKCRVDADPFQTCTTPYTTANLNDGAHTIDVYAIDPAGNEDPTPDSRGFTVDTTPPDTMINSGPSGPISTPAPQFTFASDDNTATFECKIDFGPFNPCTTPYTTPTLPDGPHTVQIRAVDPAGNPDPTPDSRSFTIDTTPPDTQIDAGPGPFTGDDTPEFQFSSPDDNTATFECRVDSGTFSSCTSPFVTASLSEGSHTFYVRAVDPGGNRDASPSSRNFVVDTIDPETTITSGPSGPTADSTPTFAFDSDEPGSSFECRIDSDPFAPCSSPFTSASLLDGAHTFEVRAIDQAANADPTPPTRSFTVDTAAPGTTIDSGPTGTINSDQATFTFSSADGSAVFECKLDGGDWEECVSPQSFTDLSDGAHTFEVRAVDPAGNADPAPPSRSFTVSTAAPETSIDSGPSGTTNSAAATLTFSSDDNAATFECRLDGGAFAACTSPQNLSGLSDGSHTFRVRAIDADSNVDPTPATRSWTVDTTGPNSSFDSGPNGPTKNASPSFEFSANEPGSTFECSLDGGGFASCSSPHALSGLGDGPHTLGVRAIDAGNNTGGATTRSFTVDTAPPATTIDTGPSGTVGSSAATFTFHSNEGGSSFTCTLDGVITACSSPKAYTGLGDGNHTFTVAATDPAGNSDLTPDSRTWTIGGGGNPQTEITAGPSGRVLTRSASFEFSSSAAGATFECALDGAAFSACSSPQSYSGLSSGDHSFSVRSKSPGGATDPTPATRTFTVEDAAAPPSKQPPRIDVVAGKLKLKKSIQVATISCGFGPCSLDAATASLKAGKKKATLTPTVSGPIAADSTAPVTLTLKGKFYRAIKKKGKGKIKITLEASSPAGSTKAATKLKLTAKKKKKGKG